MLWSWSITSTWHDCYCNADKLEIFFLKLKHDITNFLNPYHIYIYLFFFAKKKAELKPLYCYLVIQTFIENYFIGGLDHLYFDKDVFVWLSPNWLLNTIWPVKGLMLFNGCLTTTHWNFLGPQMCVKTFFFRTGEDKWADFFVQNAAQV